jgi:signal transduction histidine kinase
MALSQARHATTQGDDGGAQLLALVQGRHSVHRLLQHVCLLERRLRGGGEPTDLLLLVQDIKFAIEELHALLHPAEQAVSPTQQTSTVLTADSRERHVPARRQRVELGPLLARCVATVRQRLQGSGAPVRCHIPSDLPVLTVDPDAVSQIFSLLFEHALRASGKEERDVRVQWTQETLVVEIDDAGRGIAQETYARVRQLVAQLDGALRVSHELGRRSRVELTFPPAATSGNLARQAVPLHPQGRRG